MSEIIAWAEVNECENLKPDRFTTELTRRAKRKALGVVLHGFP